MGKFSSMPRRPEHGHYLFESTINYLFLDKIAKYRLTFAKTLHRPVPQSVSNRIEALTPNAMLISYEEALSIVRLTAKRRQKHFNTTHEDFALKDAVGRISSNTTVAEVTTPPFDTSAMDGYAVNSVYTANAKEDDPAIFRVKGTVAAGDPPLELSETENDLPNCVEIMTGAQFPKSLGDGVFDACVRVEDTSSIQDSPDGRQYIQVRNPVSYNRHRRLAGSDFARSDTVLRKFQMISPKHVMACASIGISRLKVLRKPRVALWCTGAELSTHWDSNKHENSIRDSNGPYISSLLKLWGVQVDFMGFIEDDVSQFVQKVRLGLDQSNYDLVLTTGAVSAGKFDIVRKGLEALGAAIGFHRVAIRPGHPILFAQLPSDSVNYNSMREHQDYGMQLNGPMMGAIDFFGLPGNPVACAACLQFFVLPYLNVLTSQQGDPGTFARIKLSDISGNSDARAAPILEQVQACSGQLDVFRHGTLFQTKQGAEVILSEDQSPSKVKPYVQSTCWVHIPRGTQKLALNSVVRCFPMCLE